MFKVKSLGRDLDNFRTILSGVEFGFRELELVFEVTAEPIPTPLRINFIVKKDSSKKSIELEIGEILDNNLNIIFYNIPDVGSSGLIQPISILNTGNKILGFMFQVEPINNSECYKMSYQFYNGTFEPQGGEK